MRIILILVLMNLTVNAAQADGHWRGGGWRGGWHGGGWRGDGWRGDGWREGWGGWRGEGWGDGIGWLAPALIGGALGYSLAQPQPVYVQPPPVYVQPPVVAAPQGAYAGPPPQPVYRQVLEFNPACNCNIQVLRQVGWQ